MDIFEATLPELYQKSVLAFPNTTKRQYATDPIVIVEMRWLPFIGMKTLLVRGVAKSEEKLYDAVILFKNVNYDGKQVRLRASDLHEYTLNKIPVSSTNVLLRCNCPDFRWRFAWYDHLDKALYNKPPRKYESKGVQGPANPLELPGMCKHLMKMVHTISETGMFL